MQVLKEEIREKILLVAEDMFYQTGFLDTTMRSISSKVGISVSNLYLYYENKEAIFYAVTDGLYNYFINGMQIFFDPESKIEQIDISISDYIRKIIIDYQKKFVILMDKSQGTKYETLKKEVIQVLNLHFKSQVNITLMQDELILYILAKNLIEGIIEISKNYQNETWLKHNIDTLVKYHMNGMIYLRQSY